MTASPKKGEIFTATARDLASDGRGIVSHPSGLTVFVPGIWPGETALIRFKDWQKKVGLGEVSELLEASSERVTALCAHHGFATGKCGGCPWQYISYPAQLLAKQERVEQALARLWNGTAETIWPSPQRFAYRNRAQLKTDGKQIGYMSAASNQLAPIQECPILTPKNQQLLAQLLEKLPNNAWRAKRKNELNSLHIDESVDAAAITPGERLLFQQSNSAQNQTMQDWLAKQIAELPTDYRVLELFCGAGNFTETLSQQGFTNIVAVDGQGPAIAQLEKRHLPGVTALAKDLFSPGALKKLYQQLPTTQQQFDLLLLDPPRDGLKERNGLVNAKHPFKTIIYISCNLATFTRDCQYFFEQGYRLDVVQPLDQAPHTPHIELLSRFTHL